MAKVQSLHYEDYRPIQPGDKGTVPGHPDQNWVYSKELAKKKRWLISPKTGRTISLREFQKNARGKTYTKFVQERIQKGEQPKKYKQKQEPAPRKAPVKAPVKPPAIPVKKEPQPPKQIAPTRVATGKMRTKINERVLFLKRRYAQKLSNELGYRVNWVEMEDFEKTQFWEEYHRLVYRPYHPSEDEFRDEFERYFDMDYDEVDDIHYGDTP